MKSRRTEAVRSIALGILLAFAASSANADAVDEGRNLAKQAIEAAKGSDHGRAADLFAKALVARPNHPQLTYRLAVASANAGRFDDAFRALEDFAAMGLKADIAADEELKSLPRDARFAALQKQFAQNATPKGAVTVAATIAETQLLTEGVALDATTGRTFVSSVNKRKIIVIDHSGRATDFVPSASNGLWGAFGMALDKSGALWVATSALAHAENITPQDKGRAGLFAYNATSGALKRRALAPNDGKEHVFGDLAIAANGAVYTTDSTSPFVYRVGAGDTVEVAAASDTYHSLQGLALSADEKKLAVADYANGIHIIDLATGKDTLLAMPARTTLHGVDGMMRHGRDLVAIQNGIDPQRAILIRMDKDWRAIERVEVLAANLAAMPEPSLVSAAGADALIMADAQWSRFDDDGKIKSQEPFTPIRVVRLKLPAPRS